MQWATPRLGPNPDRHHARQRLRLGCLAVFFVLGLLLVIDPVAFAAGLAAVFVVGGLWGISADSAEEVQRLKREWILTGPCRRSGGHAPCVSARW